MEGVGCGGGGGDIQREEGREPWTRERSEREGQTPSTGLRHPSFKEEGAGKRCSECEGGGNSEERVVVRGRQQREGFRERQRQTDRDTETETAKDRATETETQRQTDGERQTDRDRGTEAGRQADRQRQGRRDREPVG